MPELRRDQIFSRNPTHHIERGQTYREARLRDAVRPAVIQVQDFLPAGRVAVIDAWTGRWHRPVPVEALHPYPRTIVGRRRRSGWIFISPGDHLAEYLDSVLPGPDWVAHGWTGVRDHCFFAGSGTVTLWNPDDIARAITALAAIGWYADDITGSSGIPELSVRHLGAVGLCPVSLHHGGTLLRCARPRNHGGHHGDAGPDWSTLPPYLPEVP
ncbi:hypothetical protein F4556_006251 [Kitasatospora gansuensis]|uniref:Uncharacterized protein n=1 Tax=Kitasatospora gansuensis TaxID=258050 RepID=A0A7W7WKS6_9ACTN|nr:hypothetical protein [Kitasatospora gansuensis]MBB4950716.1 hypothetical protein [Kitasatospora gansuensis]